MTITLELKPETEERLRADAEAKGLSISQRVEELIEAHTPPRLSKEERYAQMMEIVKKWHALPTLDNRSADEIIGYDEYGLPTR